MNYAKIYERFIAARRLVERDLTYFEKHHIIPRSLGGGNGMANLIRLSPDDHFFAHLLLAKIYGSKMIYAAQMMRNRVGKVRGRLARDRYAWVARLHAQVARAANLGKKSSPQHRANMAKAMTGKTMTAEARAKISASLQGHTASAEARAKMSEAAKGRTQSPESIAKTAAANRGRKMTAEQCRASSERQKGRPGKPLTDAAKAKLRAANIGKTLSAEHKAKIGAAHRARLANLQSA